MQRLRMFDVLVKFLVLIIFLGGVKSQCGQSCDALASYYIWEGTNLTFTSAIFSTTINNILSFNPQITNPGAIVVGERVEVPFSCNCVNNEFMAHQFSYQVRSGDTYQDVAQRYYSNLTTVDMMTRFNSYAPTNIPITARLNIPVNCSCGNSRVSRDYGLFVTYPLRPGQSLSSIANEISLPERLLQDYNPVVDFGRGSGLVFVPGRDQNGTYPPLRIKSTD